MAVGGDPVVSRWFSTSLGDALLAGEPLSRIDELFRAEHARAGRPRDMAVFVRYESAGRLHCEVRAYFSPASAPVASAMGAAPCDRPSPEGLSLVAGVPEAWRALFPDREA
jgi:hypothetical protein